jgi:serine phosphatase RsbU (regulator of sigma subunit)
MALSRTLIRTYAAEFDADPEVVFYAANQRLLQDARANLFVTAFYGILDPSSGVFIYSNAGHNPPFLVTPQNINQLRSLKRTGLALGIEEETTWNQESTQINPGDVLVLYTDGIPDAQNKTGDFFEDDRLIEIAFRNPDQTAHQLQDSILNDMQDFIEDTPQFDDITLMILKRD